ncbi:hypothetical protein HII31_04825 [Pseudocercospora fuligena]|uniref:Uncharacterized protein n=1 Tax=Pseudocercospora fuligena TaxID=685502 RepID=A0A8H6RLB0_9PEZI|nr:hypothetical protein HII31_04825 [Pseudocercospora fuligena]
MAQIKFVPARRAKPRELSELMQTLPQELFDDIYNLTFTAEPGLRDLGRICSHNWGRSFVRYHRGQQFLGADTRALLQVDRASRAKYASSYYGEGSIFIAHTAYAAMTWMHSVAPEHRSLIAALPRTLAWAGFGVGGHGPHQILRADHNGWEKVMSISLFRRGLFID